MAPTAFAPGEEEPPAPEQPPPPLQELSPPNCDHGGYSKCGPPWLDTTGWNTPSGTPIPAELVPPIPEEASCSSGMGGTSAAGPRDGAPS